MMACPSLVISRSLRSDDPNSTELQERVKTLEKRMDSKSAFRYITYMLFSFQHSQSIKPQCTSSSLKFNVNMAEDRII